jgi:orotate phosphoribosyltransferase
MNNLLSQPPNEEERKLLIDWLNLFSLKTGEEFELSSGQKSNIYVDVKKTALGHRCTKLLAKLLCEKMFQTFGMVEAVAGEGFGGIHLASIVGMQQPFGCDTVLVRKEPKDHGTKQMFEYSTMFQDQHLVVLEDVVTTGKSALYAAELLKNAGYDVKGILAVVDRRAVKSDMLGWYKFAALVNFEELTP